MERFSFAHGELNRFDQRWCAVCADWHGWAYACEHYPPELREELARVHGASFSRGHPIYYRYDGDGRWRYEDGAVDDDSRACAHCHLMHEPDGPDPCLGWMTNVQAACCGHGGIDRAYIMLRPCLPRTSEAP